MDKTRRLQLRHIVDVLSWGARWGSGRCCVTLTHHSWLTAPLPENAKPTADLEVLNVVLILELGESLPLLHTVILLGSFRAWRLAVITIKLLWSRFGLL